jgi:CubicO group peptidase (beta-lactamase class C family)
MHGRVHARQPSFSARLMKLSALFAFVLCVDAAHARTLEEAAPEIMRVAERELESRPLAGVVVGVRHGGETFTAAIGFSDKERGVLTETDTVFRIASITKTLTATSVLMLHEAGRVVLDADIRRYVPTFPKKSHPVHVRHLLGNLSGISNYKNCRLECHDKVPKTTAQALAVFSSWPLEAKPGERYVYSTYGFNVLGALVENVSGTSYDAFLRERLGPRAGLAHTRVDRGPRDARRAKGYRVKDGALVPSEVIDVTGRFAGGGAVSTVPDLLRFGEALATGRIVGRDTVRLMSTSMATDDGRLTKYGMGMATYPLAGRRVMGHAGGQPETSSLLLMYPGHDLVIAVVTNTEDQWPALYAIAGRAAELLFNDGERRRGIAARTLEDTFFTEALATAFTHGLADYEMGTRAQNSGALVRAADASRRFLDDALLSKGGEELSRALSLATGPNESAPLTTYGVFAAGAIAHAFGTDVLESMHRAGPLTFFTRFADACVKLDCPDAYRLSLTHIAHLSALERAHRESTTDALRTILVDRDTDLDVLEQLLLAPARDFSVMPDFGDELVDESARARAAGDTARAHRALTLAHTFSPRQGKVLFAVGEQHLTAGQLDLGRRFLDESRALPGAWERFAPERAIPLANKLQREPQGNDAAAVLLDIAARAMRDKPELYEALAKVHVKRGDKAAAKSAREAALAVTKARAKPRRE